MTASPTLLERVLKQTSAVHDTEGIRGVGYIPPGVVLSYAGLAAPAGWFLCYGQAASRTSYVDLLAALTLQLTGSLTSTSPTVSSASVDITTLGLIGAKVEGTGVPSGTTILSATSSTITLSANATASGTAVSLRIFPHGNGDGSTTFNVPDGRGRVAGGKDDMGGTAASRLTVGGSGVTGTTLGASGGAETNTLTAAQIPAHTHPLASGGAVTGAGSFANFWQGSGPSSSGTNTANSTGGGGAHNNAQPTLVLNHIIKT